MSVYLGPTKIKQINVLFNDGEGNISEQDIKSGKKVLGINGTFTAADTIAGGVQAASLDEILEGYGAFMDGVQVSGGLHINNYYVSEELPSSDIGNDGDIYLKI